jgi:hypothetical protein
MLEAGAAMCSFDQPGRRRLRRLLGRQITPRPSRPLARRGIPMHYSEKELAEDVAYASRGQ